MASSLTYQFRQQQQQQQQLDNKQDGLSATNLPSPPDSSYGEDNTPFTSSAACAPPFSLPNHLPRNDMTNGNQAPQHPPDSLQSHFSTLTLQAITNSLPENYTIDHSSIKASLQQALVTTVAAATKTLPTPIPIESPIQATSPAPTFTQLSSTMPATGGLTIRHPSTTNHRHYSESPSTPHNHHHHHHHHTNSNNPPTSSTSLPSSSTGYHRCDDCGKVYKHPSCLMKHRWEHSEEWELTSKLLLTKHQQVQMLEAAAILVSMDKHPPSSLRRLVEEEDDDDDVDILNDDDDEGGDDDEVYVNIDDDDDNDDDILMDLDEEEPMDQAHTFPSMVGSTPAMLPSSFSTHVV
ncbi:hypothetical protein [Absidia glauca]|uniref:C2H2-type domain-containing protein n=1 Tax=Absidia glauca TaxID=4829 RepID=A0A168PW19_ABSGL|nr:hypothetical protein [Absidia glauca]